MVVTRRMSKLLAGTVLGTSLIALPAFAQDAQSSAENAERNQFVAATTADASKPGRAKQDPCWGLQSGFSDGDQGWASLDPGGSATFDGRHLHRDGRRVPPA